MIDVDRVESIFSRAIELPVVKRQAFLRKSCGAEPELKAEVEALLAVHQRKDEHSFVLDRPVAIDKTTDLSSLESEGDMIGRYRLLEKIGEGGMGIVYMARQSTDVQRTVAIKVVKLGMDTRQVIARFEAERQALALFDHPNITRVLDAGSTPSGRPYFVMELVRGINICEFATKQKLSLNDRLTLFIDVCLAVQHAHQKGIIHRDLKPSNILVTNFDGKPMPKVIDFGIAKALDRPLTEKTLFTRYSALIGTPQYMSPEQAELTGHDIDTRSDIYSLGVLLYELVTGETPLESRELKQLNPMMLVETLKNNTADAPSTRISKLQQSELQGSWPVSRQELTRRVRGELDWIILKAISRDRSLRYASATEFANDIGCFINGDPVSAAAPGNLYKLKTYFRKHRTSFSVALGIALTLIISTVACCVFAYSTYCAKLDQARLVVDLKANNTRLENAQSQIKTYTEEQLYGTANSRAFIRFFHSLNSEMMSIQLQSRDEWQVQFSGIAEALQSSIDGEGQPAVHPHFPEIPAGGEFENIEFHVCLNEEILLDLQYRELVQRPLNRIRDQIRKEQDLFADLETETGPHQHSHECITDYQERMSEKLDELTRKRRPDFFRLLVKEYRHVFGESDPRVAGGLELLAAALLEAKEFGEAEAVLRESISIRQNSLVDNPRDLDLTSAYKLLRIAQKR